MKSSYKPAGIFLKRRTYKKWILVCDGEEIPFHKKCLALLNMPICKQHFQEIKLFEETTIRYKTGTHWHHDDKFRNDITNQIKK